jgi:threonine/homoserine/homoserine lactone efflux protein
MDLKTLIAFVALDVLLVLTPGADWAFAIAAGLRRSAIGASVAGLAGGYLVHVGLVTAGAGALITNSPAALNALTLVGAAYLAWLGVGAAWHPARVTASDKGGATEPEARSGVVGAPGATSRACW